MAWRTRRVLTGAAFGLGLLTTACGDDTVSRDPPVTDREITALSATDGKTTANSTLPVRAAATVSTVAAGLGPGPAQMCGSGESPALAGYDLATGAYMWSVCSSEDARHSVLKASDDVVYLEIVSPDGEQRLAAYTSDGRALRDANPLESPPTLSDLSQSESNAMVVEGVRIEGGQDDPTTAFDDETGEVLWTEPGSPVYDDVWAVGDGAVFVMNNGRLVAYELTTGAVRWSVKPGVGGESGPWPWLVDGDRLFAIWTNLAVFSTADGATLWRTDYPPVEFPRMTGVAANDDSVFVAFSSLASGGD